MFKRIKTALQRFFFPPAGSSRWVMALPYLVLGVITLVLITGGIYGWQYTNLPSFCGYSCHTMPPENAAYLVSPHNQVYCTECHVGRSLFGTEVARKIEDVREIYSQIFHTYTFPIRASYTRPALETCEKCHQPEAFSGDKLLLINHFESDRYNTPLSIYLIMKTGGGAKEQGLGKGIHWHIISTVEYYSTDPLSQDIPFVRVYNDDGSYTDYMDTESSIDPATISEGDLKKVDCITCHNRVTHNFKYPADSVDAALSQGLISTNIPFIRAKAVEVLSAPYNSRDEAVAGIENIKNYYNENYPNYYKDYTQVIDSAVREIQYIYDQTVFQDQKIDWTTYPNNLGHINSPGCFRCHDGKHLDDQQQAIRLECNLCHSIPVVATSQDFVSTIEIVRGPEPSSHLNPNWISLHHDLFDATCSNCHTTGDPGGTSNTSFCSNSACHGTVFTYAGFDAPSLRAILEAQLPKPTTSPELPTITGTPTYEQIRSLFTACTACHNSTAPSASLDLSSYEGIMLGGKDGVIIVPGDATGSLLVQIQKATHFLNLSPDQLSIVEDWINAGALEK